MAFLHDAFESLIPLQSSPHEYSDLDVYIPVVYNGQTYRIQKLHYICPKCGTKNKSVNAANTLSLPYARIQICTICNTTYNAKFKTQQEIAYQIKNKQFNK